MIKVWIIALSILIVAGGMIAAHWLLRNAKDKKTFLRVTVYIYVPLALWSVIYFCVCLGYAGAWLSWIWIWPLITVFCMIRIFMIKRELEGSSRFKIPTAVRIIYRVLFFAGLAIFLFVESRVVSSMTAVPVKNHDYVIVLGAGLIGKEPTNPLRVRIEKAAEYMSENPYFLMKSPNRRSNRSPEYVNPAEVERPAPAPTTTASASSIACRRRATSA